MRDVWGPTAIRITELALTPDFKHLVALGFISNTPATTEATQSSGSSDEEARVLGEDPPLGNDAAQVRRITVFDFPRFATRPLGNDAVQVGMIVFDFATRQTESCVVFLSSSLMGIYMATEDVSTC